MFPTNIESFLQCPLSSYFADERLGVSVNSVLWLITTPFLVSAFSFSLWMIFTVLKKCVLKCCKNISNNGRLLYSKLDLPIQSSFLS